MKILLVEDHAFLRESIAQVLLQLGADVRVIQESDGQRALGRLLKEQDVSLVMLDLALPGMDGLECLAALRQRDEQLPILVVSAFDDATTVKRVKAGGATGFISKRCSGALLLSAVQAVLGGVPCWPPESVLLPEVKTVTDITGQSISAEEYGLTERQVTVLQLLVAGHSNREIADRLGLQEGTVKVHLNSIFKILGVSSRSQAIVAVGKFVIRFEQ